MSREPENLQELRDWSDHGEERSCCKCNSIFKTCAHGIDHCKVCSEKAWDEFKEKLADCQSSLPEAYRWEFRKPV